jgi:hypothetical protein
MPERAQRGRWMKTDPEPDLEIPMLIDYIDVKDQIDESIRASYGGGRPNSGYLIDCDGRVLEQHEWAWSDPAAEGRQGDIDFEDLAASLDVYLANPPGCYTNVAPELTPTSAPTAMPPTAVRPTATKAPTLIPLPIPTKVEEMVGRLLLPWLQR